MLTGAAAARVRRHEGRKACNVAADEAGAKAKAARELAREVERRARDERRAVVEATKGTRSKARAACKASERSQLEKDRAARAKLRETFEEENRSYKVSEMGERLRKTHAQKRPAKTPAERRAELEEQAERDIEAEDPRLLAVWHKVKSKIRATAHRSRAEAFADWVHDNRAEVDAMIAENERADFESDWQAWASKRAA